MHTTVPPIRPPEEVTEENHVLEAFQRLRQRLKRLATAVTGNGYDADDVLQDVFVKMWDRQQQPANLSEASAILTTSVKHASIDVVRKRHAQDADFLDDLPECDTPTDDPQADDPAETRFRIVQQIIAHQLTPAQQRILVMHDYESRDYATIAQRLGMNEAAVRMQLSRARKAVRNAYLQRTADSAH